MSQVKVLDNCVTCWKLLHKFESCPLYLWTGQPLDLSDVAMFYAVDVIMVISSLLPYFLGAAIMLLALVKRKNFLICQATVIGLQLVVCRIMKSIIRQPRPECKHFT